MSSVDTLSEAKRVLTEEAEALIALAGRLDDSFIAACQSVYACTGRVIVTGMGKSGMVGRKIASTLASTGTPSFFMHPAEALHGDLGMVTPHDVVVILSYSGETDEVIAILPALRRVAKSLIAVTGNTVSSTLSKSCDIALDVRVSKEACPLNLAPMTSTTAMIAVGDAMAAAVMQLRGFTASDYAVLHPAGSLGRRLLLRVGDLMRRDRELVSVPPHTTLHDALFAISRAGAGAACVVSEVDGTLVGVVTDGDVRRFLLTDVVDPLSRPVSEAMTAQPRTTVADRLASDTLSIFSLPGGRLIGDVPVIDEIGRPVGVLALKDLVRAGIVLPEE